MQPCRAEMPVLFGSMIIVPSLNDDCNYRVLEIVPDWSKSSSLLLLPLGGKEVIVLDIV